MRQVFSDLKLINLNADQAKTLPTTATDENNTIENSISDSNSNININSFISYFQNINLDILAEEFEKKQINESLDVGMQDNFKILMTGIDSLKDLDNNDMDHYKQINLEILMENDNYEVFGSIISKNNLKIEDFFVTFGFYDFDGFSAIKKV